MASKRKEKECLIDTEHLITILREDKPRKDVVYLKEETIKVCCIWLRNLAHL